MSIIVLCFPQLVDFHVTRTLARAQWDILGFGPYASLPRERRMEVRHTRLRILLLADTDQAVERWIAEYHKQTGPAAHYQKFYRLHRTLIP